MCKIIELNTADYELIVIKTRPEIAIKYLKGDQESKQNFKKQFLTISEANNYLELIQEIKTAEIEKIKKELNAISSAKDKLIELDMN